MSSRLRIMLLAASTLVIGALAPRAAAAGSDPYQACLDHCWGRYQLCIGGPTPVEECDARLDRCEVGCYT